jgi:hypothetical protein
MTLRRTFKLVNASVRARVAELLRDLPEGWVVTFGEPTRTLDQNAAQWPYLDAFAKTLKWPVNGELVDMTAEEWKDVLTAAFFGETVRLAQGLNGGVVMLGLRTSQFSKRQFSEWIEFLKATAALRGVDPYPDAHVATDASNAPRLPPLVERREKAFA